MEFVLMIGMGVMLVGGIWILIEAFKESILWGIGCLLLAPVSIVFVFMHWDVSKKPFLIHLGGLGIAIIAVIAGANAPL